MTWADRTVRVLAGREHYAADHALVVRQNTDEQEATLQIRRVMCSGQEELQIEIAIVKTGKKRNTHAYSSFVVSPEIADLIVTACKEMRT
jgi:hypothetical protein